MPEAHISADGNVVGAMALAIGDLVEADVAAAGGAGGRLPAALIALHEFAGGRRIDVLAGALRVSHSRAVRIVDRLVADGLARRQADAQDGRAVLVDLTASGRRAARRALAARAAVLEELLGALGDDQREAFAEAARALLEAATQSRRHARSICRLCDAHACGHADGSCPVTRGADRAEGR